VQGGKQASIGWTILGGNVTDTAIQKSAVKPLAEDMERVLIMGDLAGLKPEQRLSYYKAVCDSVGLNYLTKPFDYITLNNRLVLYAKRECTDQLRKIHGVSVERLETQYLETVYIVTAYGKDKTGRTDTATGAVPVTYPDKYKDKDGKWVAHPRAGKTLIGEELANSIMKAETKAKRRLTLSIVGLGMLDESEIDSVPEFVAPEPEPNMDVKCSACGGVNGHDVDCSTKYPAKPKAAKVKAEPKPEPVPSKQEEKQEVAPEGKVLEPESKDKKYKAFFYVESVKDGMTKSKTPYQTLVGNIRGQTSKIQVQIFHASLRANTSLLKGNWAEIEVTAKPKASNPAETMYALENIIGCEDENGYTPWKDGKPSAEDVTKHGVPAEEVFGDTP
jgi:hypothetical protein